MDIKYFKHEQKVRNKLYIFEIQCNTVEEIEEKVLFNEFGKFIEANSTGLESLVLNKQKLVSWASERGITFHVMSFYQKKEEEQTPENK